MKLPHFVPCPEGTDRALRAKELRDLSSEISRERPHAVSESNGEETDYVSAGFPTNFTKGLYHNAFGIVDDPHDYALFVEAINAEDNNLFVSSQFGAQSKTVSSPLFQCTIDGKVPKWRGWESPRAGHVYELEGPDPGSLGMAPAPRVGSSEAAAELAEIYLLALLRDVPFNDIRLGTSKKKLCEGRGSALLNGNDAAAFLNQMPFYNGAGITSSTPLNKGEEGLNRFERDRRFARTQDIGAPYTAAVTAETAFRGSTRGALRGPYLSQFMLIGNDSRDGQGGTGSNFPGTSSSFDFRDGFINYGALTIDQRTTTQKNCLDYMTTWTHWLDVQNGANLRGDLFEKKRRFITTPRDLATYVHFDALYEAYLNAVLILDGMGVPTAKGFPESSYAGGALTPQRTGFATFGGPHILSLVTEVATRCLKAVRRQKFNYHRRGRPELLGGRVTLIECGDKDTLKALGCSVDAFRHLHDELPANLRKLVRKHNAEQNTPGMNAMRRVQCPASDPSWFKPECNLLLPMAFPEGSPMHPSYGAGHATVAGGCVTMIKAFFDMFEDCNSGKERELRSKAGDPIVYIPDHDGAKLVKDATFKGALTIQGELDKLAANIAIGRNMAGVHYYADYYDSLRLGERVAVGILMEQVPTYGDPLEVRFTSFDGDLITISGQGGAAPTLTVQDRAGSRVPTSDWWLRHVVGDQVILDT